MSTRALSPRRTPAFAFDTIRKCGRLVAALAAAATALAFMPRAVQAQSAVAPRVLEVHAAAEPLDAHADVLVATTSDIYRTDDGVSQLTPEKLAAGGMATITLAIHSPTAADTAEARRSAREEIDAKLARIHELVDANPDLLEIALGSADLERIHAEDRIAILIGFQNAYAFDGDTSLVEHYVEGGVRVFAFNHAGNNAFADSSRPATPGDEPHGGLSAIGRSAVDRLNDLGVVIDVSQLTPEGVFQTVERSRAPVIASHSGVRALVDETRNLLDEEIDAIADAGGVIHVPPFNTYIATRPPEFVERLGTIRAGFGLPTEFRGVLDDAQTLPPQRRGEYTAAALASVPRADLEDYVDHIEYVVDRVGIDHVGIGTDFDHGSGIIGYRDASEAPNLTRALLERGYSADDIRKIWSGNFLRVLGAAEAVAAPVAR